jgi:hypothetical protein
MSINEKVKKMKSRIIDVEDDVEDLEARIERLERQQKDSRNSGIGGSCHCQETPFNPFAMFGLTPGVNLPPLGTRLEKDEIATLAKGLAIGMGLKGFEDVIDRFCKSAPDREETSDEDTDRCEEGQKERDHE